MKIVVNETWEQQRKKVQQLLSDEKTGEIYGQCKVDVELVFGYPKAHWVSLECPSGPTRLVEMNEGLRLWPCTDESARP